VPPPEAGAANADRPASRPPRRKAYGAGARPTGSAARAADRIRGARGRSGRERQEYGDGRQAAGRRDADEHVDRPHDGPQRADGEQQIPDRGERAAHTHADQQRGGGADQEDGRRQQRGVHAGFL
jgi:hypothetical protein